MDSVHELLGGRVRLIKANALSIPLEDETVNCCVTSPPYWGLRDYGTGNWVGGDSGCGHTKPSIADSSKALATSTLVGSTDTQNHQKEASYKKVCGLCGAVRVDEQLGLERTPEEYVDKMVKVFREVRRVLKKEGTLWLNLGDSYAGSGKGARDNKNGGQKEVYIPDSDSPQAKIPKVPEGLKPKDLVGIPWMVAFALRSDGWYLRQEIIWAKPNPMPESVLDRCTKSHEHIFLFSKSPKYYCNMKAIAEPFVSSAPKKMRNIGGETYAQHGRLTPLSSKPRTGYSDTGRRNKRDVWTVSTLAIKR